MPKLAAHEPLSRLQRIDEALHARRTHLTTGVLARELDVNQRTISRDIVFMRDFLQAPIEYDRENQTYRYTDDTFRIPAFIMTHQAFAAMETALQLIRSYGDTPFLARLRDLVEKVRKYEKDHRNQTLARIRSRPETDGGGQSTFSVNPVSSRPVDAQHFQDLETALTQRREIAMTYWSAGRDETTRRNVEPLRLHYAANNWYLIARDTGHQDLRNFALNRIHELTVTERRFLPYDRQELESYLHEHFEAFRGAEEADVTVRFDAWQSRWIREQSWPGEVARRDIPLCEARLKAHSSGNPLSERPDDLSPCPAGVGDDLRPNNQSLADAHTRAFAGGLEIQFHVHGLEGLIPWIRSFGPHAEVLSPPSLRARFAHDAQQTVVHYEGISPDEMCQSPASNDPLPSQPKRMIWNVTSKSDTATTACNGQNSERPESQT